MIEFTVIIPHFNIPDLLQRCLDSIPPRDDVQVIVVDDNSDRNIVDFNSFPRWKGKNYTTVFSDVHLNAGGARNLALKRACGKWIVFADADDVFTSDAGRIFDSYRNCTEDVVLFGIYYCDVDDIGNWREDNWYVSTVRNWQAVQDRSPREVMLLLTTSWAKFIKLSLIRSRDIQFETRENHNDTIFITKVALSAGSIRCSFDDILYVWTFRNGSLSNVNTKRKAANYLSSECEYYSLVKNAGLQGSLPDKSMCYLNNLRIFNLFEQIPFFMKFFVKGVFFHKSKYGGNVSYRYRIKRAVHIFLIGFKNIVRDI